MKAIKLENRKVVISEHGTSRVVTAPSGVSYCCYKNRWAAYIINEAGDGWDRVYFSCKAYGGVGAFEMALEARDESLRFLLNRRLLPRIRRAYEIREINGFFLVRDPLEKITRKFTSLQAAAQFNHDITQAWVDEYTFDRANAVQLYTPQGNPKRRKTPFQHAQDAFNATFH